MKLASILTTLLGAGIAASVAVSPPANGQPGTLAVRELDTSDLAGLAGLAKRDANTAVDHAAFRTTSAAVLSGNSVVLHGQDATLFNASDLEDHMPLQARSPDNYDVCYSGGQVVINSINQYRQSARLPLLKWNAQRTYTSALTGYNNMVQNLFKTPRHYLFQGSYAQVLSPGINDQTVCSRNIRPYTPFQLSWFAWLCEVPKDPAIHTSCSRASQISHLVCPTGAEATGHHSILANKDYKTIGCSFTRNPYGRGCDMWTGFWICDLGI
jgi:uncharacterized protein YkwD